MLCELPPIDDPAVLIGTATADDAAVYRLDDKRAIVQSVDLITPIVDDPYDYGQIAAANSISDVYAMGGKPLFALAVACFPSRQVSLDTLGRILQGGIAKAREAGIAVVGGHSVEDQEPKYGLVVTGLISLDRILANAGARPGDVLVLTKPIGTGILTTALKQKQLQDEAIRKVVHVMTTLNRTAAEALEGLQVHALTDITGFGLLGHLVEMVVASGVGARLNGPAVPVFDQAWPLAQRGLYPGGTKRNLAHFGPAVHWAQGTSKETEIIFADPQTSGGLLIAIVPEEVHLLLDRLADAVVIGEITAGPSGQVQVDGSQGGPWPQSNT